MALALVALAACVCKSEGSRGQAPAALPPCQSVTVTAEGRAPFLCQTARAYCTPFHRAEAAVLWACTLTCWRPVVGRKRPVGPPGASPCPEVWGGGLCRPRHVLSRSGWPRKCGPGPESPHSPRDTPSQELLTLPEAVETSLRPPQTPATHKVLTQSRDLYRLGLRKPPRRRRGWGVAPQPAVGNRAAGMTRWPCAVCACGRRGLQGTLSNRPRDTLSNPNFTQTMNN